MPGQPWIHTCSACNWRTTVRSACTWLNSIISFLNTCLRLFHFVQHNYCLYLPSFVRSINPTAQIVRRYLSPAGRFSLWGFCGHKLRDSANVLSKSMTILSCIHYSSIMPLASSRYAERLALNRTMLASIINLGAGWTPNCYQTWQSPFSKTAFPELQVA
jgi:hypothetical protein